MLCDLAPLAKVLNPSLMIQWTVGLPRQRRYDMLASADPGVQTKTVHVYRILAVLFMVVFQSRVFLILDTDSVLSVDVFSGPYA
jgi:hypothetical protein